MAKSEQVPDLAIEDISERPTILFSCGEGGRILVKGDIAFSIPPTNSTNAGRLVLGSVKKGFIKAEPDPKNHRVCLSVVSAACEKAESNQLLIRIPPGINTFQVISGDHKFLFLYYETGDGSNILPYLFPLGSDPNQTMPELVLIVSPVPPRDASSATEILDKGPTLTLDQVNARRKQVDPKALPFTTMEC